MTEQKPSVGRIVHYVSHGTPIRGDGTQAYKSECRAAIITAVRGEANEHGECVSLCVLNPTGQFFNEHVCQNEDPQPEGYRPGGTWHWPERV